MDEKQLHGVFAHGGEAARLIALYSTPEDAQTRADVLELGTPSPGQGRCCGTVPLGDRRYTAEAVTLWEAARMLAAEGVR